MSEKQKKIILTEKDIEDGKRLNVIYESLSKEGKIMATTYLSALRDKEMMDEAG